MNRHLQIYSAIPNEVLGTPIRQEPAKPSPETPWKPIVGHPNHVERTNAQGAREVTHRDWVTGRVPEAPNEPIITPLVASPVAEAPTEWQSGPPPSIGWFNAEVEPPSIGILKRYFNGKSWSGCVFDANGDASRTQRLLRESHSISFIQWRGPRLTGSCWPEPACAEVA